MKGGLLSPSKEMGMTMVSFLPDSIETGWDRHGLNPSLVWKGQGLAMALLSSRRGHATVFLRRGDGQQPSSSPLSEERAEEVVKAVALISLRKGALP